MFESIDGVKKSYPLGSVLHYEGDALSSVVVLISGACKAYKVSRDSEIFLYSLDSGAIVSDFGGVALSSVEFTADSEVMIYDFDEVTAMGFSGAIVMLSAAIERNLLLNKALNVGMVFDAVAKVAHFLLNDIDSFNSLKRCVVAERLNISSETLSRVLNKLQKTNAIKIVDKVVFVESEKELLSYL